MGTGHQWEKKIVGNDEYRVPARKKFLGTDGYWVPAKFSTMPTPDLIIKFYLPLRLRKAGGTRETHWATCHNEVTRSKTKEFLKSPCFF